MDKILQCVFIYLKPDLIVEDEKQQVLHTEIFKFAFTLCGEKVNFSGSRRENVSNAGSILFRFYMSYVEIKWVLVSSF